MKPLRNELLKKHTSFRIGGPADYFYLPKNIEDLKKALGFAEEKHLPVAVVGAGTNLLALDRGFRGQVICLKGGLDWINIKDGQVAVGAGTLLPRLVNFLLRKNLSGLEFLMGIPGTVGGAVVGNAGAWGQEIGRFIRRVKAIDRGGKEKIFEKKELGLGYRKSIFQKGQYLVTEVEFKLKKRKKSAIKNKIKEYLEKKKNAQPIGSPNAGSVFKNPKNDYAGRLIEAAGLKGARIGDAAISPKHANFILNLGEAKARDVIALITKTQKAVKDKFGVLLEPEIKIMVKSFS